MLTLSLLLLVSGTSVAAEPRIVFSSNRDGNNEIYTINPDGSGLVRVTNDPGQDAAPVWSPDGTKVAFASDRDGDFEIYLADVDGSNLQQLTNNEVVDFAPAFSPDGSRIAFSTDRVGDRDIFVMNADGSDPQPVTEGAGTEEEPAWSPDGTKIAFWRSVDVFTVDTDGSNLTNLTSEFEPVSVRPAWSPDGSRIAFETTTDGIWTMAADGTDFQQVLTDGLGPDWSPDGTQLVYWGSNPPPEGPSDILIVSADGGEPVAVTEDEFIDRDPDWHIAETGGGGGESETTITTSPSDYEQTASATFAFTATGSSPSFECSLGSGPFTSCTSPTTYTDLGDGPHRFRVRNVNDGTQDLHFWSVDTVSSDGTLDVHNGAVVNEDNGFPVGAEQGHEVAQLFAPTDGGDLIEVRVAGSCPGTFDVVARVETVDDALPSGEVLAQGTASWGTDSTFKRFLFDDPPTLAEGVDYALVLEGDTLCAAFFADANSPHAKVTYERMTNPSPTAWVAADGVRMAYATFMREAGGEEPSFVVTNTNDAGAGSLRQAMLDANANEDANTITFAIPGTGLHTISIASPLPGVVRPVTIDGTSQPREGTGTNPLIALDGSDAGEGADGFRLGGTDSTVKGLLISGFPGSGIAVTGERATIEGNWIGTDATGLKRVPNGDGISMFDAEETMIRGNVVSGNAGNGIEVLNDGSPDLNFTFQNLVGVGADGETPLGNGGHGIFLSNSDFMLAGDDGSLPTSPPVFPVPDGGNTIAYNAGAGVFVDGAFGNRIVANSIHSNGGLGIDLAPAGVTPNDVEDGDEGPNELQNFPELESVQLTPETTDRVDIRASVAAVVAGETYRIDYYANFACDGSGNGEGERHLGHAVATSGGGSVEFVSTSIGPVAAAELITATVTDPSGNTSEFSACEAIGEDLGELAFTDPSECVPGFLGGHTIDFEDAPESGSLAETYADLGIHFVDGEEATPVPSRNPSRITSSPPTSLLNDPDAIEGSSDDVPLVIRFDEPQTAVGFFLGNGGDVLATVTASSGDEVGSVQIAVPNDAVDTYIGIKLDDGTFDELTVDYGGAFGPEELDDLCFLTSEDEGEESDAITLTSDRKTVPAGVMNVPLSAVPSNQLPSFAGSPASAPVGSIPVGSIPVGSIPVGSIPVGSIPVGSIPVGSIPVGSIPVGSIPVGSIGLSAVPVGSIGLDQILLSQLPVDADALLAGTPLVDRPRQSITLGDVYANATTRARFNALSLPESGLMQSILSGVPFSAFLLGSATLSQLPAPGSSTWCAAITTAGGSCTGVGGSNTVVGLAIAGIPVGSIPVGSIPVGSIPVGSIPVGSIPVGSIDLVASRLAGIPVGSIPTSTRGEVVELPFEGTLGEAKAAGRIRPGAQLRHLVGAFPANLVLNDLIMGIVPRSALAWEGFPLDGFQLFAGTGEDVRYRLAFTLACPVASNVAARVRLPDGWLYEPGSTRWRYGTGTPLAGAEPSTTSRAGARWTELPGTPCPSGVSSRQVELSFDALSGLTLGIEDATASVTMGATTHSTGDEAPVLVTQNWEANDALDGARTIGANRLIVGHVAKAGDVELFRLPVPEERGTRTTVLLSHIAEGADFDLTIYKPETPSLQSSPVGSIPVGSIPVEDGGSSVDNRGDALPPETLQDIPVGSIPVGSIPVGSISANRGNADEAALVVTDGEEGFYTIAVSGYNGSHSDRPFVLRVVQTPPPDLPPCPVRGLTLGAPGTLPAPSAGVKTLFVVNRQRMAALHGAQATADMLAAAAAVAGRPEVAGQILEVDGNAGVRAAYAAWDASPCSIDAVNGVVAAINAVVATYRAASPNVENVVLLGSDDAVPMMRRLDPVTISNETDEAPDLLFTLRNGNANALYASAALGYFLSDTVYGAFTSVPWLGRDLYLPNVAVGRLVETATEIERQLLLYVSKDGLLDPQSTLTTAYDFLADGGRAVAAGLANVGTANEALIDETWTASVLTPKLTSPADVLSVNAHYSHWLLQPAAGSALVSTGDLPDVEDAFTERILFTMGCHGGLNVPDSLLGASPSAFQRERMLDWTQSYARANAAVYVANTGFGYGDTVANALSERLMSIFAGELSDGGTIGERWLDSVHEYYGTAGVYGVYDEKALTEATFYGLPFWSLGPESGSPPPGGGPLTDDPVSGLPVASLDVEPTVADHLTPRGRFWDADGDTLAIHYRPIQPRVAVDVTRPGLVATGVIVKSLRTEDVGGVDPVHHTPTIDLAANEPERRFRELIFPANAVSLTRSRTVSGERQHAVVIAGQYRPGSAPNSGTERLIREIGLEVAYAESVADPTPPLIEQVSAVNTSSATIFVRASETGAGSVRRVAALYADAGAAGVWSFVELSFDSSLGGWAATVPTSGPVQVIAMAQNADGLVAYSANKGVNFPSVTDTTGPEILLEAPGPDAVYLLNQRVTPSFSCSDAGVVVECEGSPLVGGLLDTSQVGERIFTITARDLSGRETTLEVPYVVRYVFEGFFAPIDNSPTVNVGQAGRAYPIRWRLKDANGVAVRTLAAVRSISRLRLASCAAGGEDTIEDSVDVATSELKFDTGAGQYQYTWKTERSDAGCRRVVVELADGTLRTADFLLR